MNQQEIQREIRTLVETLGSPASRKPSESPAEAEARQTSLLLELFGLLSTCCPDPPSYQRRVLGAAERLSQRAQFRPSAACTELFDISHAREEKARGMRLDEQARLQGAPPPEEEAPPDSHRIADTALRCRAAFLHHRNRLYIELEKDPWLHRTEVVVRAGAVTDVLNAHCGALVGRHKLCLVRVATLESGDIEVAMERAGADPAQDAGELRAQVAGLLSIRRRRVRVLPTSPPPYNTAVRISNSVRPETVAIVCEQLRGVCSAMSAAFPFDEALYHIILNGSVHLYEVCCRIAVRGLLREAILFLGWAVQSCNTVLTLTQVKFLPWRVRLMHAIAWCYDCLGSPGAASKVAQEALSVSCELYALETADMVPPTPTALATLTRCISDCQALVFRYSVVCGAQAEAAPAAKGAKGKDAGPGVGDVVPKLRAGITGAPSGSGAALGPQEFAGAAIAALLGTVSDERQRVIFRADLPVPPPPPIAPAPGAAEGAEGGAGSVEMLLRACDTLLAEAAPGAGAVPPAVLLDLVKQSHAYSAWDLFEKWSAAAEAAIAPQAAAEAAASGGAPTGESAVMLRELALVRSIAELRGFFATSLAQFTAVQQALIAAAVPVGCPAVLTTDVCGAAAGEQAVVQAVAPDAQLVLDVGGRTVSDVPLSAVRCDGAGLARFADIASDAAVLVYQLLTKCGDSEQVEELPFAAFEVIEAAADVLVRCGSFDAMLCCSAVLLFARHCEDTAQTRGSASTRTVTIALPEAEAPDDASPTKGFFKDLQKSVTLLSDLSLERVTKRVRLRYDLGLAVRGTTVAEVISGGPAAQAGLRNVGVVIRSIDGHRVLGEQDIRGAVAIARKQGAGTVEVEIEDRDAKRRWLARPLPLLRNLIAMVRERRGFFLRNGAAPAHSLTAAAHPDKRAVTSSPSLMYKTLAVLQAEAERAVVRLRMKVGVELLTQRLLREQHNRVAMLKKREQQAALFGALSAREKVVLEHEETRAVEPPAADPDVERAVIAEAKGADGGKDGARVAVALMEIATFYRTRKESAQRLARAHAAVQTLTEQEAQWAAEARASDGAVALAVATGTSFPGGLLQAWLVEAAHRCGSDDLAEKVAAELAPRFVVRGGGRDPVTKECTVPRWDANPACFDKLDEGCVLEAPTPLLEAVAKALIAAAHVQLQRDPAPTVFHDDPEQSHDPQRFRLGARQHRALRAANGLLLALQMADLADNPALTVLACNRLLNCLLPVLRTKIKCFLTLRPLALMADVLVSLKGKFLCDANLQALMARVLHDLLGAAQGAAAGGIPPALLAMCTARFASAWKLVHGHHNDFQSKHIARLAYEVKRYHAEDAGAGKGAEGGGAAAAEKGKKPAKGKDVPAADSSPTLNMLAREVSTEDEVPIEYLELLDLLVFTMPECIETLEQSGIALPGVYAAVAPHVQRNPEKVLTDLNRDHREHYLYPKLATQAVVSLCSSHDKARLKLVEQGVGQIFTALSQRYNSLCKAEQLTLKPLDDARLELRERNSAPAVRPDAAADKGKAGKGKSPAAAEEAEPDPAARAKAEQELASQKALLCMRRFKTRLKYRKKRTELLRSDVPCRAHLNLIQAVITFARVAERRAAAGRDWAVEEPPEPPPPAKGAPAKGAAPPPVEKLPSVAELDGALTEEETREHWKDEVEVVRCLSRAIVLFSRVNRWKHAYNAIIFLHNAMRVMFAPPQFEPLPTPLPLPPKARSPDPSQHPPPGLQPHVSPLDKGKRVQDGLALCQKDIGTALCHMVTMLEAFEDGFDLKDYVDSLNPLVVETWMDRTEPGGMQGLTTSLRSRLSASGKAATAFRADYERREAEHAKRSRLMNGWSTEPVVVHLERSTDLLHDLGVTLDEATVVGVREGGAAQAAGLAKRWVLTVAEDGSCDWDTVTDPWVLAEVNDQKVTPGQLKELFEKLAREPSAKIVFEPPPGSRWHAGLREVWAEGTNNKEEEFKLRSALEEEEAAARRELAAAPEAAALPSGVPSSWTAPPKGYGHDEESEPESLAVTAAGVTWFVAESKLDLQHFMEHHGRDAQCRFVGGCPQDFARPLELYESGVTCWVDVSRLTGLKKVSISSSGVTIGGASQTSLAAAALENATRNDRSKGGVRSQLMPQIAELLTGRGLSLPCEGNCCDPDVMRRVSARKWGVQAIMVDAISQEKSEVPLDEALTKDWNSSYLYALFVPYSGPKRDAQGAETAPSASAESPVTGGRGTRRTDGGAEQVWEDIPFKSRLGAMDLDTVVAIAAYFMRALQFGPLSPYPAGLRYGEEINRLLRDHYAGDLIPLVMSFQARVGRAMGSNEELMTKVFRDMPRATTMVNSARVALLEYRQSTEWHRVLDRASQGRQGPIRGDVYREIVARFQAADAWLRQKHITLPSMRVMSELGQLHCDHLNFKEAGRAWKTGVDTALGDVDSWKRWRELTADQRGEPAYLGDERIPAPKLLLERLGLPKLLLSITLLSRLSAQVFASDQCAAVEHALFAAWLARAALAGHVSHPERECDLRCLTPKDILCDIDPFGGALGVDGIELVYALAHAAYVCLGVGHAVLALPAAALLEYTAKYAARSREYVILARLLRVRALADIGDFSGASEVMHTVCTAQDLPHKAFSQLGIAADPLPPGVADFSTAAADAGAAKGKKPEPKKAKGAGAPVDAAVVGPAQLFLNDKDLSAPENLAAVRSLAQCVLTESLQTELGPNITRFALLTQAQLLLRVGEADPVAALEPNDPPFPAGPPNAREKPAAPRRDEPRVQACAEALGAAEALVRSLDTPADALARPDACRARYLWARIHRARGNLPRAVAMISEVLASCNGMEQTAPPARATGAARADAFRTFISVRDVASWHHLLAELLLQQRRPAAAAEVCRSCEELCARYNYLWGEREARYIRAEVSLFDGRPGVALAILTAPQGDSSQEELADETVIPPPPPKKRTIQSAKARVLRNGRLRAEGKASAPYADFGGVLDGMVVAVLYSDGDWTLVRREDGVQGFLPTSELRGEGEPPPQHTTAAPQLRPPMLDEARTYDVQGRDAFVPRLLTLAAAAHAAVHIRARTQWTAPEPADSGGGGRTKPRLQQPQEDPEAAAAAQCAASLFQEAQALLQRYAEHCGVRPRLDCHRWGALAARHCAAPAREMVLSAVYAAQVLAQGGEAPQATELLDTAVLCAKQCCMHALPRCVGLALYNTGRLRRAALPAPPDRLWGTFGVGACTFTDAEQNMVVCLAPRDFPRSRYVGTVVRKDRDAVVVRWNTHAEGGPPMELAGRVYARERPEARQWWSGEASPETLLPAPLLVLDPAPPAAAADAAGHYAVAPPAPPAERHPVWRRLDGKYFVGTGADGRWHLVKEGDCKQGSDFSAVTAGLLSSHSIHNGMPPNLLSKWVIAGGEEPPIAVGAVVQLAPSADGAAGCLRHGEAGNVLPFEPDQRRLPVRGPRGDVFLYRVRELHRGSSWFRPGGGDTVHMIGWEDLTTEQLQKHALGTRENGGAAHAAAAALADAAWTTASRGVHDHQLIRSCLLELCYLHGARHGSCREERMAHAVTAARLLLLASDISRLSQQLHSPQLLAPPGGEPPSHEKKELAKVEDLPLLIAADLAELHRRDNAAQQDWEALFPAAPDAGGGKPAAPAKGAPDPAASKRPSLRTLVQWYGEGLKELVAAPLGSRASAVLELKLLAARRYIHEAVDPATRDPPYPLLPPSTPWLEEGQVARLYERPDLPCGLLCSQMYLLDLCPDAHTQAAAAPDGGGELGGRQPPPPLPQLHWFFLLCPPAPAGVAAPPPPPAEAAGKDKDAKKKAAAGGAAEKPAGPRTLPLLGVLRVDQRHIRGLRQTVLSLRRMLRQIVDRVDELKIRQAEAAKRGVAPKAAAAPAGGEKGGKGKAPAAGGAEPALGGPEETEVRDVSSLSDVGVCYTPGTLRVDVVVPGGAADRAGVRRGMQLVEVSGPSRQGREKRMVSRREDTDYAFAVDPGVPKVAVFKLQDIVSLETRYDLLRLSFWEQMAQMLRTARNLSDATEPGGGKGLGRRVLPPPPRAPVEGPQAATLAAASVAAAVSVVQELPHVPAESPGLRPDPLVAVDPPRCLQPPLELQRLCGIGDKVEVTEEICYILSDGRVRLPVGSLGTVLGGDELGNVRVEWDGGEVRWVYQRDLLRIRNREPRTIADMATHLYGVASLLLQILDPAGGVADATNSTAAREVSEWLHNALYLV
eukprot:TRINITY_DN21370_c0_g2_i1.p1 TRINITY_DN21370_c0_g2~~TRINITY_DN21370_c0_g2_i1.p1  ORF type:complete len:4236 (+),score=1617.18 TRINITY_DN21370_c0_g2_i1:88-12708(+)